ncbi:MAG: sensor histidine kinase [Planctomycetota bacterium]|nr:sensor histidine kinase [Planctomycetota bacterium]
MDNSKKTASFHTQGRLLQELGERLVARADVALTELIKNSYDADAQSCTVRLSGDTLAITDDGHGMSEEEFLAKWMEIATPDKQRHRQSRKYKRSVTGSKGIGRFAVRFLGLKLELATVASVGTGGKQRLSITFDWAALDRVPHLQDARIPYQVSQVSVDTPTGTSLTISKLRNPAEIQITKELRTDLLAVANAYTGLKRGRFTSTGPSADDPGFKIILPDTAAEDDSDLTNKLLNNAFARLTIDCRKTGVRIEIHDKAHKLLLRRTIRRPSAISNGFFADIRYFPRRKGMFVGSGVDGRVAWGWIRDNKNNGIGIVDHGFRIRPYGFGEDDWLQLGYDAGHRRREWRIAFMEKNYKIPAAAASKAKLNPMLYLPNSHQLVGAVFVESVSASKPKSQEDLTPSMDREGFVDNEAFTELRNYVRTGLELLAFVDHREQRRAEKRKRNADARALRKDFKSAVEYIEAVPGLKKADRVAVVERFQQLSKELEDTEEYFRVGTAKLEMMGLLGVMAGFVTHEMERVLHGLEEILKKVANLERKDHSLASVRKEIESAIETVGGQLDYSTAFIAAVHDSQKPPGTYYSRASAQMVVKQFHSFTTKRGIEVTVDIDAKVKAPPVPKALYNGIVMNLFTNALKAAVGGETASKTPRVIIKGWYDGGNHVLEVADTGIGIPPSIQKRIWDPLFTTTSAADFNPLGSGMGLGLTLVKQLMTDVSGRISLVDPPPGFSTCFRATFPQSVG